MGIITLTTDLGHRDFYQAALKGSIISLLPDVRLVDISHEIPSFNIQNAAFILQNAYHYFPKGTVHLIGIDTVFEENSRYVAMKFNDHYFVGADNGIFSIILGEQKAEELIEIELMQDLRFLHFPVADVLVKAACRIASGTNILELGTKIDAPLQKVTLSPIIESNHIKGHVTYIDSFGNVISNISKDLFNKVQNGRNFILNFKRNETIEKMSWHYNEVSEGEKLCLFGISNYLEIAINKGNASQLLGLYQDEMIMIEFKD
ncbi:SAM hydrolase/SAM-dependent halogenase family protein [Sphingobacterium rhinopitheci]|uniref:SAM hydrolase/SAM-dependent halogenase family protein n=1 Tax=Sphingobacterium rhinopitheci TaxID=2781960 RepID=UPI001F52988D|nr:SAM-dependent chlorinase/fluorinase [Sphingobacterium rhinopitheci]MCI0920827.1 SAM-dependent chlorinase/fluorinase [Sphingobacterium rhinopitheci]